MPVFSRDTLVNLPDFHAYISTLIGGQANRPFSMRAILDESEADAKRGELIRERSRMKYGKRREEVEEEVADSLPYDAKGEVSSFAAKSWIAARQCC